MALTRPKIWDIDTKITAFNDPITVLHQGATSANVDVGFLFNRANGLVSNVAVYWSESGNTFVTGFTSNTGGTDSNIAISTYANLTVGNMLFVNGAGLYVNGSLGAAGSVLGSNGSSLAWVAGGGFNGGSITTALVISNTTVSTSTTTGALQTTGGAGIAGDINIGANLVYGAVLTSSRTINNISTAPVAIDWFGNLSYRSAKYLISITDVTNSQYQTSEIAMVQNGTTSTISSYGLVYSGASARMTFTANIMTGNVILWGTGISANNTVKLVRTLVPV